MNQKNTYEPRQGSLARYIFSFLVLLSCFVAGYLFWINGKDITFDQAIIEQDISSVEDNEYTQLKSPEMASEAEILATDSLHPEFIINEGDTLGSILEEANISSNDANLIIKAFSSKYNPRKLNIGTVIEVNFTKPSDNLTPIFESMIVNITNLKRISVARNAKNEFIATEMLVPLVQQIVHQQGTIKNSVINTALELSVPANAIMSMIRAFSYDVDFQRDIKRGDKLEVVMEKFYTEDGKLSHTGNILYSSLTLSDRKISIYQMTDADGEISYYNEKGESIRKEFLRTPINAAKISSKFGMRNHPVLGYSRMHKGVDFSAPVGTPILAAGSGVVEVAKRYGNYGKYIRIKHNSTYSTAYGHASRFAKGITAGSKVKQGQVIAYVGMTGITSGPHLHYEVIEKGKQINPLKFKFASNSQKLTGKALEAFNNKKKLIAKYLPQTS